MSQLNNNLSATNTNLARVNTYVGNDGKLHFTNSAGADSVLNFSSGGGALFLAGILSTDTGHAYSRTFLYDPDTYQIDHTMQYTVKKAGYLSTMIREQLDQTFRYYVKVNGTVVATGTPAYAIAAANVAYVNVGDVIRIAGDNWTYASNGVICLYITPNSNTTFVKNPT